MRDDQVRKQVRKDFRTAFFICLGILGLLVAFVILPNFPAYSEYRYVCENTGSEKGFRRWFVGVETGHWYSESPLEAFMREKFPRELTNRWARYSVSNESVFGVPLSGGHARPDAYRYLLPNMDLLRRWRRHADDAEIRGFYHLLVAGDRDKTQERVAQILDEARAFSD